MSDIDVLGLLDAAVPQGPRQSADGALHTTGVVYGVDPAAAQVQVDVHGTPMWLPAVAGRYVASAAPGAAGLARILLNPSSGRPALVVGPVRPRDPAVPATLTAIDTGTHRATVTVDGVAWELPYLASTYSVGAPVWVGLNDWGVPYLVHGPSDLPAAPLTPPAPPAGAGSVTMQATIGPQWSGSWSARVPAWDRWNVGRYGGRSTLYQGNGFGSGPMKGLATYGDQIVNLGATTITAVDVMLRGVDLSGASGPATVQGSPHGAQPAGAPSSSGATATGDGWTALPSGFFEPMRTGSVKGLCTVGGNYWAVAGAGNGDGMALRITYTRPA